MTKAGAQRLGYANNMWHSEPRPRPHRNTLPISPLNLLPPSRRHTVMVNTGPCSVAEFAHPEEPVQLRMHRFDGFCYIPSGLHVQLDSAGYEPDPVIQQHVGMAIELVEICVRSIGPLPNRRTTIPFVVGTKCSGRRSATSKL